MRSAAVNTMKKQSRTGYVGEGGPVWMLRWVGADISFREGRMSFSSLHGVTSRIQQNSTYPD
jgi:hypothetical protein